MNELAFFHTALIGSMRYEANVPTGVNERGTFTATLVRGSAMLEII